MGGSGKSYSPQRSTVDCADLAFATVINSAEHLNSLKKGELLALAKNARHEIIFKKATDVEVGKLFSSNLLKLSNCIDRGFQYSAIVDEIKDDVCRVSIFCSKSP